MQQPGDKPVPSNEIDASLEWLKDWGEATRGEKSAFIDGFRAAMSARSATAAIPEVRLDEHGVLDEICTDNVHLERLDRNYWFLSVSGGGKSIAAWLSAKPTFEWREEFAVTEIGDTKP